MKQQKEKLAMIVDDDIDSLAQLTSYLERMGFTVLSAENQASGEELMGRMKPDLAIFDLMMEQMDSGFILSYKIKQRYPEVPVMIMTSVTAETGMIFGLQSAADRSWIKADAYLEKGLRFEQLEYQVSQLMQSKCQY